MTTTTPVQKEQKAKRLDAVLDKLQQHLGRGPDALNDQVALGQRVGRRCRRPPPPVSGDMAASPLDDHQDQLRLLHTHLPRLSVLDNTSTLKSHVSPTHRVLESATLRSSSLHADSSLLPACEIEQHERSTTTRTTRTTTRTTPSSTIVGRATRASKASSLSSDLSSLSSRETQESPLDLSVRASSSSLSRSSTSTTSGTEMRSRSESVRTTKRKSVALGNRSVMSRFGMPVRGKVANEIRAYVCPVCGQMFALQDRLAKHVASRHKRQESLTIKPSVAKLAAPPPPPPPLPTSPPLPPASPTPLDVDASGAAGKAYVCDVCQRCFARSDMLTRHMRLHTGHKPYTCNICHQVFSRSDHLSTHQRTHTGEKPYRCPICPYAACRRDMITRHMRTHTRYDASSSKMASGADESSLME